MNRKTVYLQFIALATIGSDPMKFTQTKCAPLRRSVPVMLGVSRSCLGARLFNL